MNSRNTRLHIALSVILSLVFNAPTEATAQQSKKQFTYNLDNPTVIALPTELAEISGLLYPGEGNSVFAITDNDGYLYEIPLLKDPKVRRWKFDEGRDYESITSVGNTLYVLNSNGDVQAARFEGQNLQPGKTYEFPFGKGNEFESMYYDDSRKMLIIICKGCKNDNKKELSTYGLNPVTGKYTERPFSIDLTRIDELKDGKKKRFKPSAATLSPFSGQVHILSSINKLLLITNINGEPVAAYELKRKRYKQPEGICFTADGRLVISNERAGKGHAELLIFAP